MTQRLNESSFANNNKVSGGPPLVTSFKYIYICLIQYKNHNFIDYNYKLFCTIYFSQCYVALTLSNYLAI